MNTPKQKRTLEERETEAAERADKLLTHLANEHKVEKPHYQIYALRCLKKLEPFKPRQTIPLTWTQRINPVPCGAWFYDGGRRPKKPMRHCITLFVRSGQISMITTIHEFFHYLKWRRDQEGWRYYNEEGYAEWYREEQKRAESETRKWWKKNREQWNTQKYGYRGYRGPIGAYTKCNGCGRWISTSEIKAVKQVSKTEYGAYCKECHAANPDEEWISPRKSSMKKLSYTSWTQ